MTPTPAGRFAPSPTSSLHLGNLRTAVVAWLMARSTGRRFLVRIEDLDRRRVAAAVGVAGEHLRDLAAIGLDWDPPVVSQSERDGLYREALAKLSPLTYECYCTRREIAEAASAPHRGFQPYPGNCRDLTEAERADRRSTRPPAIRLRAEGRHHSVVDRWAGTITAEVDDVVLVRNDGAISYNLAVVVDDLDQGVDQVVRGDDLLSSAPSQAFLAGLLGGEPPGYAHVPLAVNGEGVRLAKRDGAVTIADLAAGGLGPQAVLSVIADSLGLAGAGEKVGLSQLLNRWDPDRLPPNPWVVSPDQLLAVNSRSTT